MSADRYRIHSTDSPMTSSTSKLIDLILRVMALVSGIAVVSLLFLDIITVKNAIILVAIGIIAVSLERLSEN